MVGGRGLFVEFGLSSLVNGMVGVRDVEVGDIARSSL